MNRTGRKSMPNRRFFVLILVFGLLLLYACSRWISIAGKDKPADIFKKDDITVVVTDSGLGGLSILADSVERLRVSKAFRSVKFIFVNALFSKDSGYNSLKNRDEKILIFNNALQSMEKKFHPDLIMIGCNTLSVLYKDTPFSHRTKTAVLDIVDSGVELAAQKLKAFPQSKLILFGTQTTIEEKTHKKLLVERGFLPDRIYTQACPDLVSYIERGFDSEETEMLIFAYVDDVLQRIHARSSPLVVSLNCTHYGYSLDLWKRAFKSLGVKTTGFINPNKKMSGYFDRPELKNRNKTTSISVRVVSMVKIDADVRASIGRWLKDRSPLTASALQHYELFPHLFQWKFSSE